MTVTANGSSSSVTSRPEALSVDLAAAGLLPPMPAAFLAGYDLDLLAPLRFLAPGTLPAASALPRAPAGRPALAESLAVANRSYGHPRADELARRLADPSTRVVVAGQQPGLLGGPLLSAVKMIAAARWAAALEEAGEPAVAVFWVATEDHDYAEVAAAVVPTAEGVRSFDLGPDLEPLTPVGMRTLGPAVSDLLRELAAAAPGDWNAEWVEQVGRWYRPDARFGEAFCRLMAHLLGARCPLLLDSMLPALKSAERPWLRRLVERRQAVEEASALRDGQIGDRGFALQVSPQRGASPLFLLAGGERGERRRIEWRGAEGFALRGREQETAGGSVQELLRTIDENPGVVSPGVLARPALQDAVLGTCLQVLGPGELSYLPQAAALYPVIEVEGPLAALRPQALILDSRQIERLAKTGLTLAALLGDRPALDRAQAERSGVDFLAPARRRVEETLQGLRGPALALDPNLERPWEKTREQVLRALDLFAEKAVAAAVRRDEVQSRRIAQLREACLPLGRPQERVVAVAHFGSRYGPRFAESLWEQMELDPAHLQVISP
ncbi:MAG TPA: bacillithiol biosynthesis cysteine-adding enzyme BshC [Thermoanaerobaculia bacterium]|nr:bacillithiol biosynthesis cysteine-adding enzyme BshC [Thermoanaerobaculia bacterium]